VAKYFVNTNIYMSRTLNILLSMFLLGFLLVPGEISACTSHTKEINKKEKSCCDDSSDDNHTEQDCKKDCCKDKEDGNSDCSGNCGQKSCPNSFPTFWMHDIKDSPNAFFFESEKSYSLYKQPSFSSGFHSIWQPPKIG